MNSKLSDALAEAIREAIKDELKKRVITITAPAFTIPMADNTCARDKYSWTDVEDRELAKTLRQAITSFADRYERSPFRVARRVRDNGILF